MAGKNRRGRMVWGAAAALVPAVALMTAAGAFPAEDADHEAIQYAASAPDDAVARLQARMDRGEVVLKRDPSRGYLASVLRELKISASSQALVFSKTSVQRDRISPRSPRALYFNDETYIGWVQGGGMLEVSSADPRLGAVFYVLDQEAEGKPRFVRQTHECLSCHGSTLTMNVPGHVIRSVFARADGQPILNAGTFITTDRSPVRERWGGWYVTGTHGAQEHMGNVFARSAEDADELDRGAGANVTRLRGRVDTTPYLSPHSDLVALMVLQHQAYVHNLITRAGYQTRIALHYEQALNRDLGRSADHRSESTERRIRGAVEPLVRGLLFSGEAPLAGSVAGTSTFAAEFARRGPADGKGRSLREFDLRRRLFRYPCSYLIYSEAFRALPAEAREHAYHRLDEILSGKDQTPEFAHLSGPDREAVREILRETDPGFAAVGPASP